MSGAAQTQPGRPGTGRRIRARVILAFFVLAGVWGCATRPVEAPEAGVEKAEMVGREGCDPGEDPALDAPAGGIVDETVIAEAQSTLEEKTCQSALWLDGLMVEGEGDLEAARRTHGYVETSSSYSEFFGSDTRIRARVRMELPNWERRLSVYVGRENEQDFVQDRRDKSERLAEFPSLDEGDAWLAGLGYSLPKNDRFQTDVRVGVASLRHPRAFVQARGLANLYADRRNLFYARSTLFWNTREGFGNTSGLEYNRVLRERLLLRLRQSGTVSQESEGLEWIASTILYRRLEQARGISGEVFVRGRTEAEEPLREYGLRSTLQFPLVRDRLVGELLAGYSWPRTDPALPREGSYQVGFGVRLLFGRDEEL